MGPVGVNDSRERRTTALAVEVMNTRTVGPNLELAPDASIADGLLDVVLISEPHRSSLEEHLACQLLGGSPPPRLPSITGRAVQLLPGDTPVHVDGATWELADGPLELRVDSCVEILVGRSATAWRHRSGQAPRDTPPALEPGDPQRAGCDGPQLATDGAVSRGVVQTPTPGTPAYASPDFSR